MMASTLMSSLQDAFDLFRLRVRHDPEAFGRVYDRYAEAVYRFIVMKVPTPEDAQDLAAETFTRAWQYLQDHRNVTHLRALLYRIARNLIIDFYRKKKAVVSLEETVTFVDGGTSTYTDALEHDKSYGKILVEAQADVALILKRIGLLKEDYRDVLYLRLIDDLPFGAIAEILEKDSGAVRVMYHRAMKSLKEILPS